MIQTMQLLASVPRDIEGDVKSFSIRLILTASLVLIVLMIIAAISVNNKKLHLLKKPLFVIIVATIALPTLLLAGSSVYINTISESKGPVHWHADIEYWVCGQEISFRNPIGFLSNKTGSSTFHEHNDKRIHLEGVVIEKAYDASLEKFMNVTGGNITNTSITIPTNENFIEDEMDADVPRGDPETLRQFIKYDEDNYPILLLENGMECEENVAAELQVFVIKYDEQNKTYSQTKLDEPPRYTMRDESIVPPGDCVIVEFDTPKTITDRLCREFGVRDIDRCVDFGVSEFNPSLCNLRFVLTDEQKQAIENEAMQNNEESMNFLPIDELEQVGETFGEQSEGDL